MDDPQTSAEQAAAIRLRTEALLLERSPETFEALAPEKAKQLLHELQVHQIELEMQNEEMHRLHVEMDVSRARYFDLYDLAPIGYLTVCEAGTILEANFAAAGLLGVSRKALVKHLFTRFIVHEDQDTYYLHRKQLLETPVPQAFDLQMLGRDRRPFWAHLAATVVPNASGAAELRIVLTDISARKQAEVQLRDSLAFSNNLINSMQDGFSVLDPEGVALEANPALCQMTGFSSEELVGVRPPHPYWPPEEHQRIFTALSETMKGGMHTFELTFMRKNGERFPALVSPFSVESTEGVILSYAATVRDVSERKQAEAALASERNLLHALVDLLPTWIFVKDRESRFLVANQACAKNMGSASPEEMIGKTDTDFYPPEVAARLRFEELNVLKGSPMVNQEVVKDSPDGRSHVLLVHKMPLRAPDGTITGLVGAAFDITELKEAEEELRTNEAFQRDILNSLPAHIAVLDANGVIIAVNEPWQHYSQTHDNPKPDTIGTGVSYFDVCRSACENGDPYAAAAIAGIQSVLAGKRPHFSLDYPCDDPDRKRWFAMEVHQPLGGAFGAIVAHTDISERKQAEEALRDANQKLRLHFEQTPMAVIEWDLDFRVTQWNPAARTIFGYSSEEALDQHASFIIPKAFHDQVDEIWQALIHRSGGERSTNPNVSKDGTPILCEWYNTPLIDEHGTVRGVASVVMDITEQTAALELLAWEKSALELIGSLTPLHKVLDQLMLSLEKQLPGALCSVLLLDDDGIHVRHGAAPSLPEAYNEAVDGQPIGPATGSCGTAAYIKQQVIVEEIASDPLWADYRELALKHGLHACWSTPIFSHGQVLGTFAIYYREARSPSAKEMEMVERAVQVVRLAIKRKLAEEEIRRLNTDLERRVDERTAELEAANTELESFSYSVSHDLRAPLRAVDGFSRMVITDYGPNLDDEGKRMLGVIRSEAQRMGRLIDDLLAFSRLGRVPIQGKPINMDKLAREVFDELIASEPERAVRFDLKPLPTACGTEALIRQVWVNLIGNALKFTHKCDLATIEIGAKEDVQNGWIYYIKDNGAGFDMRYVDKLFGVFQRLHNQQNFSGTGVGLALVQRIVKRHGGQIWAEGQVNIGATFYFTLPNQIS